LNKSEEISSTVRALVVCADASTIDKIGDVLQAMRIEMETCVDPQAAIRRIGREKLDALFLEWNQHSRGSDVLRFVRSSSSNRTIITFAITQESLQAADAFRDGANFIIEQPISTPRLQRVLRAAYGLILRERRRYFRCPLVVPVLVSSAGHHEVQTVSLNLSERGIAIILPHDAKTGDEVKLRFQLEGNEGWLRFQAQICWSDQSRRAGLQFTSVPIACANVLQDWLARRLEESSLAANQAGVNQAVEVGPPSLR
jgi:CheY-like chemotaxis protein